MSTFERPRMLKRAIKSVIRQTFKDWELIIVDDCSQDEKTPKLCERFRNKDSRIHYVRSCPNFGQHTRIKNTGINAAQADLIAYLDDDNEYRKDHLQVLYKYLRPELDIVYGDRWLIDKTGQGKDSIGVYSEFNASKLQQMNYIDTSDVLMRKSCLLKIGGWDESLPKFADWNLWIRCVKAGFKFQRIPIIITDYYIHKGCNQFKHDSGIDPITRRPKATFEPDACKIWPDKTSFGRRPPLKVAIFTLTMDRLEYTKRMYKSMTERAGYPFDWFVVDNRSKDGTKEWIKDYKYTEGKKHMVRTWQFNKENVGISKASNQALDLIGENYDIIIKADNDCEFMTDDWLKTIVDLYERQQKIVVAPRVEGLRDSPGGVPRENYFYVGNHFIGTAPHLGGICIVAPAELYKGFRWEEDDFLHGDQDYVFSQYVISKQCMLGYMENIIVEHTDSTIGQIKKYPDYFKEQKELKQMKYEPKHT